MLVINSEVELKNKEVIVLDTCNDEVAFQIAVQLSYQMFDSLQYKIKGIKTENGMKVVD